MTNFDKRSDADFSDASSGSSGGDFIPADFSDVQSGSSSTAPAEQQTGQSYTVKSGDTLRKIAQHFYGDEMQWKKIWHANRDQIPNPDRIQEGMKLTIPNA